jgi:negative regulator of sigma E activity
MKSVFTVGQLVRVTKIAGRLCEVVRILPVTEEGRHLYLIRSEQGAELIVSHHELRRA